MSEFVSTRTDQLLYWDDAPNRSAYGRERPNTKFSAVCRSLVDCADLVHKFRGQDFYPAYGPYLPVLLLIPGAPQQIAGWGLSTIEEIRDQSVAVWELITERLAKTGSSFDFDSAREKHGLMRREEVDAAMREAFAENIRKHKANPVTNPPRQMDYPRVRGKTVFPQPQETTWKDNSNA